MLKTRIFTLAVLTLLLGGLLFSAPLSSDIGSPSIDRVLPIKTTTANHYTAKTKLLPKSPRRDEFYSDSTFYEYGFEEGWNGWTKEALNDPPRFWHMSDVSAYIGDSWWCSDEDIDPPGYDNHWLQFLETPSLDLEDLEDLELTFAVRWNCEDPEVDPPGENGLEEYDAWDGCNVWISTNGGLSWEVLIPLRPEYNYESLFSFGFEWGMGPDIPGWCGYLEEWGFARFDLDDYASNDVKIRWAFCSDPAWATADDEEAVGFQIDNITIVSTDEVIFENDGSEIGDMVLNSGESELWEISDRDAHEGDFSMYCRNMVSVDNSLISPWLIIPGEPFERARFDFWVRVDLQDWADANNDGIPDDYFHVELNSGGEEWTEVISDWAHNQDWFDEFQYYGPGTNENDGLEEWQRMLDLTEFAGDSLRLRWVMTADAALADGDGSGLYIDTFRLLGLKRQTLVEIPRDIESIQEAIDQIEDGDTILVHPGVYMENIELTGKNITLASLFFTTGDMAYIDSTILDGGDEETVISFLEGVDSTTIFSGFTVRNGNGASGGGMHFNAASPSVSYCRIEGNISRGEGGGIFFRSGSSPTLDHCIITGNTALRGGAVSVRTSEPHFINCTISGNSTLNNGDGGGVYCRIGEPTFTNCILWDNEPQEIYFYVRNDLNSATLLYSDLEGGPDGVETNDNGEVFWEVGSIDSDPLFSDAGNGDFSLQGRSPCVDAGGPAFPFDTDTSRIDMGAFPFDNGLRDIFVSPIDGFVFEHVEPGDSAEQILTLGNISEGYLRVFSAYIDSEHEDVFSTSGLVGTYHGVDSVVSSLKFTPSEFGDYFGSLVIYSNDPDEDTLLIPIEAHSLGVQDDQPTPLSFTLDSIYPNPFNSTATIAYTIPEQMYVGVDLLDLEGRLILRLAAGSADAGTHRLTLNAGGLPAGIYILRLAGKHKVRMQKVILLK